MAMAAAACKPLSNLPPSLQTHRSHCGAFNTRQRIKSHSYHRHENSFNTSFKALHHDRENARRLYIRAVPQGDGDTEKCNKEGKDENANTDASSCEEKPETKSLGSPEQPKPVKEEEQQQSSARKEKPEPIRGRIHCFTNKLGFHKTTTTSRDEELKGRQQQNDSTQDSKQDVRCRLRSWWRHVSRPQNLLAAFLTGLLLYAFALFGWQVMVVAVDVTLFVLKCSFVAVVLLFLYLFLI